MKKIKICPYGFHINTEDSECPCYNKQMEKRFEKSFLSKGISKNASKSYWKLNNENVKNFINQELTSLLTEIVGKKKGYKHGLLKNPQYVPLEDIISIAKERGIDIKP